MRAFVVMFVVSKKWLVGWLGFNGTFRLKMLLFFVHLRSQQKRTELECGPMPNVMVALPNIGGALCSTPQSLADAHYENAVQ